MSKPRKTDSKQTIRIIRAARDAWEESRFGDLDNEQTYQHAGLCQNYFPRRQPKGLLPSEAWEKVNGRATLFVQPMPVRNPLTGKMQYLGIPYGPAVRLLLCHINTQALLQGKATIDIAHNMTAFVKSIGLSDGGKQLQIIKNQLARLASSSVSLAFETAPDRTRNATAQIIREFDLWFPKDENQHIIWDSHLTLGTDYFESLLQHAVPLNPKHLGALSQNATAIDIYSWLAHRLPRIDEKSIQLHWGVIKQQFGESYAEMKGFKRDFIAALKLVKTQYQSANFEVVQEKGLILHPSPPVIHRKIYPILGE